MGFSYKDELLCYLIDFKEVSSQLQISQYQLEVCNGASTCVLQMNRLKLDKNEFLQKRKRTPNLSARMDRYSTGPMGIGKAALLEIQKSLSISNPDKHIILQSVDSLIRFETSLENFNEDKYQNLDGSIFEFNLACLDLLFITMGSQVINSNSRWARLYIDFNLFKIILQSPNEKTRKIESIINRFNNFQIN